MRLCVCLLSRLVDSSFSSSPALIFFVFNWADVQAEVFCRFQSCWQPAHHHLEARKLLCKMLLSHSGEPQWRIFHSTEAQRKKRNISNTTFWTRNIAASNRPERHPQECDKKKAGGEKKTRESRARCRAEVDKKSFCLIFRFPDAQWKMEKLCLFVSGNLNLKFWFSYVILYTDIWRSTFLEFILHFGEKLKVLHGNNNFHFFWSKHHLGLL